MQRDINRATFSVHGMVGLFDHAENLMTRSEFCSLVPKFEVGAAQRGMRYTHQYFAVAGLRHPNALDGDTLVTVEDRGLHDRIWKGHHRLAFHRAERQSGDEPALHQHCEDKWRQRDQGGGSHQRAPLGRTFADKIEGRRDQRLGVAVR